MIMTIYINSDHWWNHSIMMVIISENLSTPMITIIRIPNQSPDASRNPTRWSGATGNCLSGVICSRCVQNAFPSDHRCIICKKDRITLVMWETLEEFSSTHTQFDDLIAVPCVAPCSWQDPCRPPHHRSNSASPSIPSASKPPWAQRWLYQSCQCDIYGRCKNMHMEDVKICTWNINIPCICK